MIKSSKKVKNQEKTKKKPRRNHEKPEKNSKKHTVDVHATTP